MKRIVRREATGSTGRAGLIRKSVAQFAVLGLVLGGAVFALAGPVGAASTHQSCQTKAVAEDEKDLTVCKTGPVSATPGTDITYTISASTTHNDEDTTTDDGFVVTDPLPSGTTLVHVSGSGWDCSASTDTNVECSRFVDDGASVSDITVTAHVDASLTNTTIENCATLVFVEDFQDGAENSDPVEACVSTDITQVADLSITKTGLSTATVGGVMQYTVTVTNNGPDTSGSINVTDAIPNGTTLVGAGGDGWSCLAGPPLLCGHAALANGASASFTVQVNVGSSLAGLPLQNCAQITLGDTSDVTTNDSSCSTAVSVAVAPAAVQAAARFTG
jgi:uncharacterized repeat protein (TIGR01451 family)